MNTALVAKRRLLMVVAYDRCKDGRVYNILHLHMFKFWDGLVWGQRDKIYG